MEEACRRTGATLLKRQSIIMRDSDFGAGAAAAHVPPCEKEGVASSEKAPLAGLSVVSAAPKVAHRAGWRPEGCSSCLLASGTLGVAE